MNTLVGFITYTKGVEYLIAIAFLFAFIVFWQLVNHRGKGLIIKLVPVIVMTLGIGALVSTCVIQQTGKTTGTLAGEETLLASPVLAEMYGPASFNHDLHQRIVQDCTVCHHNSGSETPPCSQCHSNTSKQDNSLKPELAHVYHLRCISCHIENQKGPTECTGCHRQASVPPLSITHPLTGRGNCLSCHAGGVAGVPQLPADHSGATNDVCQLCHRPVVEKAAISEMPHQVAGREDCLLCHGEGIGGAAKVPADHTGRTNETCLACHTPKVK